MKKITFKTWVVSLLIFSAIFCNGQVNVSIDDMSYNTGGNISLGNAIEVPYGNNVAVNFTVKLSKSSNQVTGNSTLRLFLEKSNNSTIQIGFDELICNTCWTTSYQTSKSITIQSSQLNNQDGDLYAEFESFSGIKYKSANWQVSVLQQPITNNTIVGNETLYSGSAASSISGSTPIGGNDIYTYKWEKKTTGNWSVISGATSKNYSPGTLTSTTKYQRIVSSSGSQHTSNTVTKTINSLPPISNNIISFNGSNLFSGSTPSGGNGTYNYEWQALSTNGSSWVSVGATSKNYSLQSPSWALAFRRIVSSSNIQSISNIISTPTINNNTIEFNGSNAIVGSTPSGGNGNYTYVWYLSIGGSDYQPVAQSTKDLFISPAVVPLFINYGAHFYREVISGYFYSNSYGVNLYGGTSAAKKSSILSKNNSDLIENLLSYLEIEKELPASYLDNTIISYEESLSLQNKEKVYPSPFSEKINFDLFYLNDTSVEVYLHSAQLTGRSIVYRGIVSAGKKSITFNIPSYYPAGLYVYEIIENGISKSGKLIKL